MKKGFTILMILISVTAIAQVDLRFMKSIRHDVQNFRDSVGIQPFKNDSLEISRHVRLMKQRLDSLKSLKIADTLSIRKIALYSAMVDSLSALDTLEQRQMESLGISSQKIAEKVSSSEQASKVQYLEGSLHRPEMPPAPVLPRIEDPIGDLNVNVPDKLSDANQNIEMDEFATKVKVGEGSIPVIPTNSSQVETAVETYVPQLTLPEVSDLQDPTASVKAVVQKQDPEVMKELALNKAKETATNHFKGHEQQLIAAMQRFSELRAKVKNPEGVIDLLHKQSNTLKSKKFKERLIGGFNLQHQNMEYIVIDLNPYLLYRVSQRFNVGTGWNERLAIADWRTLKPDNRIYGPRATVEFNIKSFVFLTLDAEYMNTRLKPIVSKDAARRDWVAGYFGGVKSRFRLSKRLIGHTTVVYSLHDPRRQSPYADKLNIRLGFELIHVK